MTVIIFRLDTDIITEHNICLPQSPQTYSKFTTEL